MKWIYKHFLILSCKNDDKKKSLININIFIICFRHQVTHYTGQLAKDTSKHLKDLNNISTGSAGGLASQSEQRQWRLQRERLQEDFTNALNKFQAAQRQAAQKEKEVIKKSRNAGNYFLFARNRGGFISVQNILHLISFGSYIT